MERINVFFSEKLRLSGYRAAGRSVRFAAALLAIGLLSGCAVQVCGDEFPYRTSACPVDSLAPVVEPG
ncbi:MAG TPA: hypothetical protein VHY80_20285 [Stellaceae bacterium]|jgi:hypothetical protein|nr:hypothetical protein [Stellaceae bacterium]